MSEIPFVQHLGDAIETAAETRARQRTSRFRRRLSAGGVAIAVAATGVAAASGVFSGAEKLASTSVGCYERADLAANVAVISPGTSSPADACARVLKGAGPLVVCAAPDHVVVFPRAKGATCAQVGLRALPADYAPIRAGINAFARELEQLEASVDCLPPREFERRVQALLDRSDKMTKWRTSLRLDVTDGPCGTVTEIGGDGRRMIEGSLSPETRRVMIFGGAARSTMDLLYGASGLAGSLMDESGSRCHTRADLEATVRRRLAGTGRALTLTAEKSAADLAGERGRRLAQGCAVVSDVHPARDGRSVVVSIVD